MYFSRLKKWFSCYKSVSWFEKGVRTYTLCDAVFKHISSEDQYIPGKHVI